MIQKICKHFCLLLERFASNHVFYLAIINTKDGKVDTHTNMTRNAEIFYLETALERKKVREE